MASSQGTSSRQAGSGEAARATGTIQAAADGREDLKRQLVWRMVLAGVMILALLGVLVSETSGFFAARILPFAIIANPADAFRLFNLNALGASDLVGGMAGIAEALPYPPAVALLSIGIFIVLALGLAVVLVRRITP